MNKENSSPPHIVDSGASVMTKELTDEEISKVGEEVFGYSFTAFEVADHYLNFARAILRRAWEK